MNHRFIFIFVLVCLFGITSCKSNLTVESSSAVNELSNKVNIISPTTSNTNQLENTSSKKVKPEVIVGSFIINQGKIVENLLWSEDAKLASQDTKENSVIDPLIKVDVLNCAGFLASAEAVYTSDLGWELKYIPETIAADVKQKAEKCGQIEKDGSILSVAFGILSENQARNSISIKKEPDYEKIIKTLPSNLKKWAKIYEKEPADYKKLFKENINNGWTDLNGDGIVDLILLSEKCASDGEADCQAIIKLEDGKWKKIALIEPL